MARVTTKTGDEGYTDLLGPVRVPKYHRRPETYGTVDEASALLGLARALGPVGEVNGWIQDMQRDLYVLMAELATPPEQYDKVDFKMNAEHLERIESLEDLLKARVTIGNRFVVPGASVAGAALDVARTVVRRAERQVVRLYHESDVTNSFAVQYLNRLSDVLFVLARYVDDGAEDSTSSS